MNSHPISVRNKSSKFTLTKKEFNDNLNKFGGNILANKIINEINNNQSDFFHYKKAALKKNIKNNPIQSSNRFGGKINNHTIDKSKKSLNTLNTDFLKLFREMNLLKKTKNSNKTAIEVSLQEKSKLKSMYNPSVSHSKSKGKNNSKTNKNKNNNVKKPKKQNSKSKNLKINSNYEPLHTDEKNNILNNTQRNIIFNSNYKKKSYNKNNKLPKKTFKTFNPFTIKFAKPINGQIKNKMKQSNITTYHINFSKLIPNKINNSLHHNINKTQEIIHNTSKTKTKQDYKKSINERNSSNNNLSQNNNIKNNINNIKNKTKTKSNSNNNNSNINTSNINNISKNQKSEKQINKEKEKEIVKDIKNIKDYLNNFIDDKNISNIDYFDEKEVNISNNDDIDDDESENSGVLAYDEVRDIIVYYDMGDLNKKQGYLFDKDDYKYFLNTKKENYLNFFLNNNNNENNRVLKIENKKRTPPTNESSKNKKNFINIIKN